MSFLQISNSLCDINLLMRLIAQVNGGKIVFRASFSNQKRTLSRNHHPFKLSFFLISYRPHIFKAVAAAKDGAKVLLVPPTQSFGDKDPYQNGLGGVNVENELRQSGFDVRVIEVHNIDEVIPYYFS